MRSSTRHCTVNSHSWKTKIIQILTTNGNHHKNDPKTKTNMISSLLSKPNIASKAAKSLAAGHQIRMLNVHEYISMELMNQHQIPTPLGAVATTPEEAEHAYTSKFTGKDAVIKAQVLSGGRGLGTFKNGFKGGVHMVTKPGQVCS